MGTPGHSRPDRTRRWLGLGRAGLLALLIACLATPAPAGDDPPSLTWAVGVNNPAYEGVRLGAISSAQLHLDDPGADDASLFVPGSFRGSLTFGESDEAAGGDPDLVSDHTLDAYVARYSPEGSLLWARQILGGHAEAEAVAGDGRGGCLVAGTGSGGAVYLGGDPHVTIPYDHGSGAWLARYGSDGEPRWGAAIHHLPSSELLPGFSGGQTIRIAAVRRGRSHVNEFGLTIQYWYVTGWYLGSAVFGEGERRRTLRSVGAHAFIACYTDFGTLRWVNDVGSDGAAQVTGLAADVRADGSCVAAGYARGSPVWETRDDDGLPRAGEEREDMHHDAWVASWDVDGRLQWVRTSRGNVMPGMSYGQFLTDLHIAVAITAGGGCAVSGPCHNPYSTGPSVGVGFGHERREEVRVLPGQGGCFLVGYDAFGGLEFAQGIAGLIRVRSLESWPDGTLVAGGTMRYAWFDDGLPTETFVSGMDFWAYAPFLAGFWGDTGHSSWATPYGPLGWRTGYVSGDPSGGGYTVGTYYGAGHTLSDGTTTLGLPSAGSGPQVWISRWEGFAAPVNEPPISHAGADREMTVGDTVVLDGTASEDPEDRELTFAWSTIASPAGPLDAPTPDPDAPAVARHTLDAVGSWRFQLTVTDPFGATDTDDVTVVAVNEPPVARGGPDRDVIVGETILLDAGASHDPDGHAISCAWSLVEGPAGNPGFLAADPSAPRVASFVTAVPGTCRFRLLVSDAYGASASDEVVVQVRTPLGALDARLSRLVQRVGQMPASALASPNRPPSANGQPSDPSGRDLLSRALASISAALSWSLPQARFRPDEAIRLLNTLRTRLDGCESPDGVDYGVSLQADDVDWVRDCRWQTPLREDVDALLGLLQETTPFDYAHGALLDAEGILSELPLHEFLGLANTYGTANAYYQAQQKAACLAVVHAGIDLLGGGAPDRASVDGLRKDLLDLLKRTDG